MVIRSSVWYTVLKAKDRKRETHYTSIVQNYFSVHFVYNQKQLEISGMTCFTCCKLECQRQNSSPEKPLIRGGVQVIITTVLYSGRPIFKSPILNKIRCGFPQSLQKM